MERDGAEHQLMLALAMLRLRGQDQAAQIRRDLAASRTPGRWRRTHSLLDRAAAALGNRR